jgi:hypothetical protein
MLGFQCPALLELVDTVSKQLWVCVTSAILSHLVQIQEVDSRQTGHSDRAERDAPQTRQEGLFGIFFKPSRQEV